MQNTIIKTISVSFLLLFSLITYSHAGLPGVDSQGNKLPTLAPMLKRATPAVVNIATSGRVKVQQSPLFNDPFFRHFFDVPDQPRERKTSSLGSGVIVDAGKGLIITNNHVIDKADEINVTLNDGREFKAKLIGTDPETDVAVIQIEAKDLTALPFANSDQLNVGDFAIAIGNPFGLGQTVTSGIVSALGRSGLGIEGYEDFIQTDASINPGNSGGALVNLNGELIGINTAIFSRSGGNIGIGFAIPINMARDVMTQLVAHGEVKRGRLGAQAQELTADLAQAFKLENGHGGAVITQVTPKSAADKAGLKAGDIVIELNGKPVRDVFDLRNIIGLLRVGQKVEMVVIRENKRKQITAVVEEPAASQSAGKNMHPKLAGASFTDISEDSPLFGRIEGVVVADVEQGSPAWASGLRKGDIITSANRKKISNMSEFSQALKGSQSLLLNVQRGRGALFLFLQ
jgi:Do/DeqQ family serine protease